MRQPQVGIELRRLIEANECLIQFTCLMINESLNGKEKGRVRVQLFHDFDFGDCLVVTADIRQKMGVMMMRES
jgi:hypothetical protein